VTARILSFERGLVQLRPDYDHRERHIRLSCLIHAGKIPRTPPTPPFTRRRHILVDDFQEPSGVQ
jgi:hypothetical protein